MRKAILVLTGLVFIASTTLVMAANKNSAPYGTVITGVNDIQREAYAGVIYPHVDGDFYYVGGTGGVYEFDNFITAESANASGNVYLAVSWWSKEHQCSVKAQVKLPLKVEKDRIVLPPNTSYKLTNLVYSDQVCGTLGIRHIILTVENDHGRRYIVKSFPNG